MISVYRTVSTKYFCVLVVIIGGLNMLGAVVQYRIGLRLCVLVDYLSLTYQNIPSVYIQIENFESLKFFDQHMILLK